MPTVPGADSYQPIAPTAPAAPVQQANYRMMEGATMRASEEQGKLAQSMQVAGREMTQQAIADQAMENEANAKMVLAKNQGVVAALLTDPTSGFLHKIGPDATAARDPTVATIQALPQAILDDLPNDAQRRMLAPHLQDMVNGALVKINDHTAQQTLNSNIAGGKLLIQSGKDSAALSFDATKDMPVLPSNYDPANATVASPYQSALAQVRANAREEARLTGVPAGDATDQYVRAHMAEAYAGTLEKLLNGGSKGQVGQLDAAGLAIAKGYYAAVKDQLPAVMQEKVEAQLDAGALKTTALDQALDVGQKFPHDIGAQEKELDARYKAGKITAEQHGAALQLARADQAQYRGEQGEQDKALLGAVWDMKNKNPNATLADLTPGQLAYIKQRGLGAHVDSIFTHDATTSNPTLFMDTISLAQTDPAKFMAMGSDGIAKLKGSLSSQEFNAVVATYNGINKHDVQQMTSDKLMHQTITDVTAQLRAAGLATAPKTEREKTNLATFQTELRDQLVAAQVAKKAPLTPDEAKTISLGLIRDQALSGTGYFGTSVGLTHMPVYKMTPEQRAANWEIPDTDRQQITQSLKRNNMPTTEANIQRVYKTSKGVR